MRGSGSVHAGLVCVFLAGSAAPHAAFAQASATNASLETLLARLDPDSIAVRPEAVREIQRRLRRAPAADSTLNAELQARGLEILLDDVAPWSLHPGYVGPGEPIRGRLRRRTGDEYRVVVESDGLDAGITRQWRDEPGVEVISRAEIEARVQPVSGTIAIGASRAFALGPIARIIFSLNSLAPPDERDGAFGGIGGRSQDLTLIVEDGVWRILAAEVVVIN